MLFYIGWWTVYSIQICYDGFGESSSTMLFGSFQAKATYLPIVSFKMIGDGLVILCVAPSRHELTFSVGKFDGCIR